eukprot:2792637-Alexandrium_andersonii.AAC.1
MGVPGRSLPRWRQAPRSPRTESSQCSQLHSVPGAVSSPGMQAKPSGGPPRLSRTGRYGRPGTSGARK